MSEKDQTAHDLKDCDISIKGIERIDIKKQTDISVDKGVK